MSDSGARKRRRWIPLLVLALALYVIVRAANTPQGGTPSPVQAPVSPHPSSAGS